MIKAITAILTTALILMSSFDNAASARPIKSFQKQITTTAYFVEAGGHTGAYYVFKLRTGKTIEFAFGPDDDTGLITNNRSGWDKRGAEFIITYQVSKGEYKLIKARFTGRVVKISRRS